MEVVATGPAHPYTCTRTPRSARVIYHDKRRPLLPHDMAKQRDIESFVAMTHASHAVATQYLDKHQGQLSEAIEDFYSGEPLSATKKPSGGRAAPAGIRTLRDLDADDDDDKTNSNFFTGGEKSGLEVEEPDKDRRNPRAAQQSLVEKIFQRASDQMNEIDDRPSAQGADVAESLAFSGAGFRLGDSNTPLEAIRQRESVKRPAKVHREIVFWRQGFTVGDGELKRYDDAENVHVLQELKQGRVPVSLLDVEFGQDVDVSVVRKVDEDYTPPKRSLSGFHGTGQRLGLPVPGEASAAAPSAGVAAGSANEGNEARAGSSAKEPQGLGDSPVQIRLANGKRVSALFNGGDSMAQVYAFVRLHELNDAQAFTLSHSFPVKPIADDSSATVASEKLKNSVIIQRRA